MAALQQPQSHQEQHRDGKRERERLEVDSPMQLIEVSQMRDEALHEEHERRHRDQRDRNLQRGG